MELERLRVEQQAQPATLYARELLRTAQLLRRQRVTYVGFDDRYIRGSDRATGVHVFAEIPGTNVLAYLRFGLGDIGGIDHAVSVHVTSQKAHRNVHIDSRLIARAIHSVDLDVDHLLIGNVGKRYCYDAPADAHCSVRVAGPSAPDASHTRDHLRLRHAGHGDITGEGHHQAVIVGGAAAAAFNSARPRQRHIDVEAARNAVGLARDRARYHRSCSLAKNFRRICRGARGVTARQPDVLGAVGVGREVAPRSHERRNGVIYCPRVSARIIRVHLAGWVGRDSAPAHDQHLAVVGKRTRLPCGPRYGCYRAGGVGARVEAERVGGVDHRATGEIRCPSHVDDATYGACGCVHDPFRRDRCTRCRLGAYGGSWVELIDTVGGGYVDVEPAQYVELVASHCKATWQDCASGIPRPVVRSGKIGQAIGDWVVVEHASCGYGWASSGATHTVDVGSA